LTSIHEGSVSIYVLLVDINVRVGQEDGNDGVTANFTSTVKGCGPTPAVILLVDFDRGIVPEDLLHLLRPARLHCFEEFLLHGFDWNERKKVGRKLLLFAQFIGWFANF